MSQIASVLISFSVIPILGRKKIKLSYVLLISAGVLGLLSGIGIEGVFDSVLNVFIKTSSIEVLLTIMMVSILGGIMKHYKILDKIVENILILIPNKKIILMILPALIGILTIPGGALLSAPFIYDLGEEMNIPPRRRAVINLVFRHIAMLLMPYSTGLLLIAATIPNLNMMKIIYYNLLFVVPVILVGYLMFIRNIKSEKNDDTSKRTKKSVYNLTILTLPIYICVIINIVTGLPLYMTMIISILAVYFLSNKIDFVKTTIKSISWQTIIMVVAILIMKEIILKMDDLLLIFNNLIKESTNILSILFVLFIASVFFGFITGNQTTSLAIMLPMVSQLQISEEMMYIYVYFTFTSAFFGYFFSPLHLCQAFTVQRMNISTLDLYKDYKYYILFMMIILFVSVCLIIAI